MRVEPPRRAQLEASRAELKRAELDLSPDENRIYFSSTTAPAPSS